jgi:hypothetical protein
LATGEIFMSINPKLNKVLEHLIKNNEEEARKLLRQVFIEKARAIHEELMNCDDEDMDESFGGTGDEGDDLTDEISTMDNEIDFEETMSEEDDDTDASFDNNADDDTFDVSTPGDDTDGETFDGADTPIELPPEDAASVEDKMNDLESALDARKAKFKSLNGGDEETDNEFPTDSVDDGEEVEDTMTIDGPGGEEVEDEETVDENWATDEDFDDLAESLDLEVIEKDVNKTVAAKDIGAASTGMSTGNDAKSPIAKSQANRMGAKPIEMKGSNVNGYERATAPKSDKLPVPNSPTRKKATDTTSKVSKEGNGSALLNKKDGVEGNKMSPLSKGGDNLK